MRLPGGRPTQRVFKIFVQQVLAGGIFLKSSLRTLLEILFLPAEFDFVGPVLAPIDMERHRINARHAAFAGQFQNRAAAAVIDTERKFQRLARIEQSFHVGNFAPRNRGFHHARVALVPRLIK